MTRSIHAGLFDARAGRLPFSLRITRRGRIADARGQVARFARHDAATAEARNLASFFWFPYSGLVAFSGNFPVAAFCVGHALGNAIAVLTQANRAWSLVAPLSVSAAGLWCVVRAALGAVQTPSLEPFDTENPVAAGSYESEKQPREAHELKQAFCLKAFHGLAPRRKALDRLRRSISRASARGVMDQRGSAPDEPGVWQVQVGAMVVAAMQVFVVGSHVSPSRQGCVSQEFVLQIPFRQV